MLGQGCCHIYGCGQYFSCIPSSAGTVDLFRYQSLVSTADNSYHLCTLLYYDILLGLCNYNITCHVNPVCAHSSCIHDPGPFLSLSNQTRL
jgi:hypothetical protein